MLALFAVFCAHAAPGPEALGPEPSPSPARDAWLSLLASGCDIEAARVRTPFEARVLRHAPYALRGHPLDNPALTELFEADGGWYAPSPAASALRPSERACAEQLGALEEKLQQLVPMSAALLDRLSADPKMFSIVRSWSAVGEEPPYGEPAERTAPNGTMWWTAPYSWCEEGECGGYLIQCSGEDGPCNTLTSG